jgi:hypothetical protein
MGSISLVAEENDVTFCVVISRVSTPMVSFLPWKARSKCGLVEKDLAVADRDRTGRRNWLKRWCRITSHEGWRMECRCGQSPQSEAPPSPHHNHMYHVSHINDSFFRTDRLPQLYTVHLTWVRIERFRNACGLSLFG